VVKSRRWIAIAVLLAPLSFAGMAAAGVLGPKDGGDLSPTDLDRVRVGDPAPDFTLESETGVPITLSDFRGRANVVLVFYRGRW
jgi:cytochrome oxidase Cu insertion factor (SCO1/SenC/PrrC family)